MLAHTPRAVPASINGPCIRVTDIVPILTVFYAANEWLASRLKLEPGWTKTGVQLGFDQLLNAPLVIAGFFAAFQVRAN